MTFSRGDGWENRVSLKVFELKKTTTTEPYRGILRNEVGPFRAAQEYGFDVADK